MSSTIRTVQYRRLGNCGLRVSVPILGGVTFGSSKWLKWVLDEEESLAIMKAAWDKGINTIDTSNFYSSGESERVIGVFLRKYNIPRERIVILSKCSETIAGDPTVFMPDPNSRDYVNQGGLSRAAIFNAVEASLARLGTSYIDLYQVHRYDPNTSIEETMKALHDLIQQGKVRYIGASSMRAWQFAEMNRVAEKYGWTTFVSMQNEYSLLYREEEREMIPYCKARGIGLIPWSPMQGGTLARSLHSAETIRSETMKGTPWERKVSDADAEIVRRVEELAKKRGWSMPQIALAWVAAKTSSPIVGINSVGRLDDAIVGGLVLSAEELRYLEAPYVPKVVRGHD